MGRIAQRISASEMLDILQKQWLDTNDIRLLASVGINKATEIKKEITAELTNNNYFVPANLVPSEEVIKKLNINVSYLKKIANFQYKV